ncbi:hypothetical protein GGI12_003247, partial [Dipsacomyces acuminosporus]
MPSSAPVSKAILEDEDEDEVEYDDEDSVPDPESYLVSSSDRPETFSVGMTEPLFADASIFAPSNALFLLDEESNTTGSNSGTGNTNTSLAAAMAIASAIKSRPMSTNTSSAMVSGRVSPTNNHSENEDEEKGSEEGSDAGNSSQQQLQLQQQALSQGAKKGGNNDNTKRNLPVHNESDDDEHSNIFFVDPNTLTSSSSDMYFDDGGFTRFLRMHVKRQQQRTSPTPPLVDHIAHLKKPGDADIEMADAGNKQQSAGASAAKNDALKFSLASQPQLQGQSFPSSSAGNSGIASGVQRLPATSPFVPAPTAVSGGLLLDTDLLSSPTASLGFTSSSLGSFIAPSLNDSSRFGGMVGSAQPLSSGLANNGSLTAIPNANPFMLPGNGQGPITDSDPITAAFYSAFGLSNSASAQLGSNNLRSTSTGASGNGGLNPSAAAALASQLARQQLAAVAANAIVGGLNTTDKSATSTNTTANNSWNSITIPQPQQQQQQQQQQQRTVSYSNGVGRNMDTSDLDSMFQAIKDNGTSIQSPTSTSASNSTTG